MITVVYDKTSRDDEIDDAVMDLSKLDDDDMIRASVGEYRDSF